VSLQASREEKQPNASAPQNQPGNSAFAQTSNKGAADAAPNQGNSHQEQLYWRGLPVGSIADWAVVLVTTGAVVAAFITLKVLRRQTAATEEAAKAASRSARAAERTMYLSLRARLCLDSVNARNFAPQSSISFQLGFKNTGGKTAIIQDYSLNQKVISPETPFTPNATMFKWFAVDCPLAAEAIHSFEVALETPIEQNAFDQINASNSEVRFVIYGALRYNDGFGKLRTVGFGRYFDPDLTRRLGSTTFAVISGKGWNYAD
jgi:hypothetical protein